MLKRSEPAIYHGRVSLRIAMENNLRPFLLGCAHEAIARALAIVTGRSVAEHIAKAQHFACQIADAEEKRVLEEDLSTFSIPNCHE